MANSCYGCQKFPIARLCRYDRREIDRKCDGCQRTTDSEYLKSMGLWIVGISHALPVFDHEAIQRSAACN